MQCIGYKSPESKLMMPLPRKFFKYTDSNKFRVITVSKTESSQRKNNYFDQFERNELQEGTFGGGPCGQLAVGYNQSLTSHIKHLFQGS